MSSSKKSKYNIKRFRPKESKRKSIWLICGKRGTGKSTCMKSLTHDMRKMYDMVVAMTPTPPTYKSFKDYAPSSLVYEYVDYGIVDRVLNKQKDLIDRNKEFHILLQMDDCAFDKKALRGTGDDGLAMRRMFQNGRHYNTSFMVAMQYCMDMSPDMRSQIDYGFFGKTQNNDVLTKYYKQYFSMFDKFKEFKSFFNKMTESREWLVLDFASDASCAIEDTIFYYKAKPRIAKFNLGRPSLWNLDHRYHVDTRQRKGNSLNKSKHYDNQSMVVFKEETDDQSIW
tara:strand:- start:8780 stop:9628 length:849 start_codon:yes stop_codon:yes gene_type:complete